MNAPFSPTTLDRLRADLAAAPRRLFIGGAFVAAQSGETFDVIDPAPGQGFASAAAGDKADIDLAVRPHVPATRLDAILILADVPDRSGRAPARPLGGATEL